MKFDKDNTIDVDFEKYKDKVRNGVILAVVAIIVIFFATSIFYKIEDGEIGVVNRMGLIIKEERNAGVHVKLPILDKVEKVNVAQVKTMEFGYKTTMTDANGVAQYDEVSEESTVIVDAANNNASIALVYLIIEYKVEDPVKYLYKVNDVDGTLRLAMEESVRDSVQRLTLDEAKTRKELIDREVKVTLQNKMDNFESGVQIVAVNTQNVEFLERVETAYQQKENANQYMNSKIEEAEKYANVIKPQAQAEATILLEEAISYKVRALADANAEMAEFNAIYEVYKNNQEITKEKYYIEAMQEFLTKNKIVIDATESGDGIYKFYNMDGDANTATKNQIVN